MAGKDAVIRGYAEALFAIAEAEGDLPAVEDELFAFAKALEGRPELREAMTAPGLPVENKRSVIRDLIGKKANPHTVNVLGFLLEQGRARDLAKIIQGLADVAADRRRHVLAEVRSAVPLSDRRRAALQKALSTATGRDVEVKVVIDPTVIGGLITRMRDEVFDGTVAGRLQHARALLGST